MISDELSNALSRFSLRCLGAQLAGGKGGQTPPPSPPSMSWKIQVASRARVNYHLQPKISKSSNSDHLLDFKLKTTIIMIQRVDRHSGSWTPARDTGTGPGHAHPDDDLLDPDLFHLTEHIRYGTTGTQKEVSV